MEGNYLRVVLADMAAHVLWDKLDVGDYVIVSSLFVVRKSQPATAPPVGWFLFCLVWMLQLAQEITPPP